MQKIGVKDRRQVFEQAFNQAEDFRENLVTRATKHMRIRNTYEKKYIKLEKITINK